MNTHVRSSLKFIDHNLFTTYPIDFGLFVLVFRFFSLFPFVACAIFLDGCLNHSYFHATTSSRGGGGGGNLGVILVWCASQIF